MEQLTTPTREEALKYLRTVELTERLQGGILTPMAGTRPLKICGLRELSEFLVVQEDVAALLVQAPLSKVHYVDPGTAARWVRDAIGDAELADALDQVIASRRPFGFLVPEMKALIEHRIAECDALLEEETATAE
ncbi:MAG: hypothetical protein CVT60_00070 [Actinobacteria bacterium HGW-Actinobacteria-10]|jgi:hypothetical protein|nr:MAG: hypothetical protein CVT60_00070 [Actinobacteria bacterium HGW-Actinobacteria-10]